MVIYTIGKETCILYTDLTTQTYFKSIDAYMNDLCLANGTTLEGCYKASHLLLGGCYKRPICINSNIYFPTHKPSSQQCIWINLNYMNHVSLEDISTLINRRLDSNKLKKQIYEATRLKSILSSSHTYAFMKSL